MTVYCRIDSILSRTVIDGDAVSFTRDRMHIAGNRPAVAWNASGAMPDDTDVTFDRIEVGELNADGKIWRLWGHFELLQAPGAG